MHFFVLRSSLFALRTLHSKSGATAVAAVAYRVGEPSPDGGRFLASWRRHLAIGAALPTLPLPLSVREAVTINLEETYARAAADAYLGEGLLCRWFVLLAKALFK